MKPFDDFLMVDWSANDSSKLGKDSIWLASSNLKKAINYPTRHDFLVGIKNMLIESINNDKRILCGFDFCFGFPHGAVDRLRAKEEKKKRKKDNWEWLWQYLADNMKDNEANENNRWDVASHMNFLLSKGKGPFWGFVKNNRTKQPTYLCTTEKGSVTAELPKFRFTETSKMQSVWKLAYPGSVGSQSLLGMAYLQKLRKSKELKKHISVYPFQNCDEASIVFSESYYSHTFLSLDENIKILDEAQVIAAVEFCKEKQESGELSTLLSPIKNPIIAKDEGWTFTTPKTEIVNKIPKTKPKKNLTPDEIYAESFAIIKSETGITGNGLEDKIRRRMIHACGDTEIADDIIINAKLDKILKLLDKPSKIITDSALCASALVKTSLPKQAEVICAIEQVGETIPPNAVIPTRSAVAMEAIRSHLKDSILLIGNAPTALERIKLGISEEGWAKPSLIIGIPVGFVGAVESKEALHHWRGTDYITLLGRKGGSAITASALNAILLHKQGSLHG